MTHATETGTRRFADRHADLPGHFRRAQGWQLSSIGLGTYLGAPTAEVDERYAAAVRRAVELGCNVIDTAGNYRYQRSERAVGRALRGLIDDGLIGRDEIILATKGGYLPFDGEYPRDPSRYIRETFIERGIMSADEIVDGHCLSPRFLQAQIEQSRRNLGVDCLDIYYIHNPESQLNTVPRAEFRTRLRRAFATLEDAVEAGHIRYYGTATWNGYRSPPGAAEYLSLDDVLSLARDVSGINHHCRFVQLPYNLAMLEALTARNQRVGDELMSVLEAAERLGVSVMCSASLLRGRLLGQLTESLRDRFGALNTDAQRALQFVRSTPGVVTALVGSATLRHIDENLATARVPPLMDEAFKHLFAAA